MEADIPYIPNLLIAFAVAYLFGSIPLAHGISRRRGIDIFNTGTGLAGASNVRRNVGTIPAAVVVLGDAAKGMAAILIAKLLGIEGPWLLFPATATVVGHWKSIFTRFKGGDGLVVLGGITLVIFTASIGYFITVCGVLVGIVVALGGQRMPYTSLMCIVLGYMVVVGLTLLWNADEINTALAIGVLGIIVFGHAVVGHARRRRAQATGDLASDS